MNAVAPIPSLIPENAPFSSEQRAWLNGFFAAYLGVNGEPAGEADASPEADEPDEDQPWHDPSLAMAERLALARDRKPQRQLMAATAQLDCGQCGYLCQTYAEAVWTGAEPDMGRCVPGGKETQRKLKELMAALESQRGEAPAAPAVKSAGPLGTRDRPALATLVDAYPLNRPGSEKDVRHVVFDLSTTDLTYEAGDSLGVFARKNPQLVQSVLDRVGATGEEIVAFDGEALPLRQVLLSKVDIARPSDDCLMFLATRAFDGEEALKLQALAEGEGPPELAEADLLDLLLAFPSVMPSLPGLLKSLDRLQPRLYSIASSSKAHPREVHLTVSAVRWDSNDRQRTGIGSCYLADFAKPGDVVPVFVQKSHGFAPPADDSLPAIMVGPGTGVAPVPRVPRGARGARRQGAELAVLRRAEAHHRFSVRGSDRRLAAPRRAGKARSRFLARPGGQGLRPASHARERGRALGVARQGRAFLCLRRRQAHGQGRRGHAAGNRRRAGRQGRGCQGVARRPRQGRPLPARCVLSLPDRERPARSCA